jgi:hypothetical protein
VKASEWPIRRRINTTYLQHKSASAYTIPTQLDEEAYKTIINSSTFY